MLHIDVNRLCVYASFFNFLKLLKIRDKNLGLKIR